MKKQHGQNTFLKLFSLGQEAKIKCSMGELENNSGW